MRVNIVLPILTRRPIGGVRVALEYADFLARRGHAVTVVHARRDAREPPSMWNRVTDVAWRAKVRLQGRLIPWHRSEKSVRHRLVGSLARLRIPDAEATIATAWQTAEAVAPLPAGKGVKFYLVQHYETWAGDKAAVDATWRLPLKKIVIARWLVDIGESLGVDDITHIPNGIDASKFRLIVPIDERPMQIVTLNHREPFKGVPDALAALHTFHGQRPDVPVVMFGAIPRGPEIPGWIEYWENPDQRVLTDRIYNTSSVYLGASTDEGWGLPAAEAMTCGCTFVGTDIGGFREFARPGVNALLTPPRDPDALARSLLTLSDDVELRRRLQHRAWSDMKAFSTDRSGSALERVLLEGVEARPSEAGSLSRSSGSKEDEEHLPGRSARPSGE